MGTMRWMVGLALLSSACEETDDPVETPWDAAGTWSLVQNVDTVDGVTTYTDFPQQVGEDLMSVYYDLSTDGSYELSVVTEAPDGTTSAMVGPDPLSWSSTGERSVVLVITEGDPSAELDCSAPEGNDDLLYCSVEMTSAYGNNHDESHAVTLQRI
jgi:hypothetical protein